MEADEIIRVFRPHIQPGRNADFERFLREVAFPLVSSKVGLIAQHAGRPMDDTSDEFVYVTVWKDLESLKGFAGENWQEAVIDPSERELLRETLDFHHS